MRKLFFFTLFAASFFSCADKVGSLENRLAILDKEMGGATVTDKKKAEEFIITAEQLAGLVEKTDSAKYADVLLKAAGLAKTIGNPQKSVELYAKLADGMPQNPKAPTALFMLGFVYENDLADLPKAKSIYESFLQKYPNDPDFADDAQTALKMLGKTPEEIIREFEQRNRDSIQVN